MLLEKVSLDKAWWIFILSQLPRFLLSNTLKYYSNLWKVKIKIIMAWSPLLCLGLKRPLWSAVTGRRGMCLMRKPRSRSWCSGNDPWSHMQRRVKVKLSRGCKGPLQGWVVVRGARTCEEPARVSRLYIEDRVVRTGQALPSLPLATQSGPHPGRIFQWVA